ncbi:MAG TPA: flagellar hook-length control protein FliK [Chitinispirillaceae bacterium]|nr:flagellar hook-length control protein FliK [Chitinispirillaceae bacterium]
MTNLPAANEVQKRMDRSKESADSSSPGFAMQNCGQKKVRFDEVYNKVAQSNQQAKQKTDNSVPPFKKSGVSEKEMQQLTDLLLSDSDPLEIEDEQSLTQPNDQLLLLCQMQLIEGLPVVPQEGNNDTEYCQQATAVIINAVKKIADTLQINITAELDKISLDNVSKENIGQLAEIVSVLKNITEVLDTTVKQGLPLDTGRTVLDVQSASQTADILRTELFKIELGLNILGISEKVQLEAARQLGTNVVTGIAQASDPADLSMPLEQISRIFGDLIEDSSQGKETGTPSIAVVENGSEPVKEISIGAFDSRTYRTLLKLEKKEKTDVQNIQTAENPEELELAHVTGPALVTDTSNLQNEAEQVPVIEVAAIKPIISQVVSTENRPAGAMHRTTEDNIMSQLSSKIPHLVRSGETEIRIQLRPESLGEVKLSIRIDGDIVAARIQVENQQVKQIVESNLQTLKDALSEQNLQTGSLEVNVGSGWGRQSDQSSQSWSHKASASNLKISSVDSTEEITVQKGIDGIETGHRYGNNSIEYYA